MDAEKVSIRISWTPFDPEAEAAHFRRRCARAGAIATFLGQVRGENGAVASLALEHYPGLTEAEIGRIAEQACARWPLEAVAIAHRVGVMAPGEPIVFVAAAAAHRRPAFEAVDFLMDYLKSEAPFWKKETGADGSARWIEPRAEDSRDKARWAPDASSQGAQRAWRK
ncbi:molybdenum cofactor biosynthesis protein MoaE [Amphiplicatus metriothermophilus]|uniref:Molybdopterin synthase catalytic subunit n=1 Tax=Amphiplicatus metriothermophilus TaxID=1519374 RepID=A0A239PTP4_9PROT|nr:molybdenum cofactor biosynthesis protein MoaE [Amphiplicatus metriothermophilus]MBB5519326.1 molybdopterin synthase catalytic subunit [Amphiplicatus metriothermophilus]SNT73403.1 molybdopterin synthase subunit MoaE [Amphiplicatus metriothermophilus]